MNKIDRIKIKIKQIEKLLVEVKNELETLSKENQFQPKSKHKEECIPSEQVLRAEYERLYGELKAKKFNSLKEFIKGKSKNYLKAFCKANSLPLDTTKASKDRIADEVMKWMVQTEAITKRAT